MRAKKTAESTAPWVVPAKSSKFVNAATPLGTGSVVKEAGGSSL